MTTHSDTDLLVYVLKQIDGGWIEDTKELLIDAEAELGEDARERLEDLLEED